MGYNWPDCELCWCKRSQLNTLWDCALCSGCSKTISMLCKFITCNILFFSKPWTCPSPRTWDFNPPHSGCAGMGDVSASNLKLLQKNSRMLYCAVFSELVRWALRTSVWTFPKLRMYPAAPHGSFHRHAVWAGAESSTSQTALSSTPSGGAAVRRVRGSNTVRDLWRLGDVEENICWGRACCLCLHHNGDHQWQYATL